MSDARIQDPSQAPTNENRGNETGQKPGAVIVKGETVADEDSKPKASADKKSAKTVAPAKVDMQSHFPALPDDSEVGVSKEHSVTRDGKAGLAFSGSLLASAAPGTAPSGKWQELRIYETTGGKYVSSRVSRSIYVEDEDEDEADLFDPSPSSMPSQLLRSARDFTRSEPLTWTDAAANFFGYEPLAKVLYRKFSDRFEEHFN